MKHRILPLLLALLLALTACAAKRQSGDAPETPAPTQTLATAPAATPKPSEPVQPPEPTPVPAEKINPLTGLPIAGSGTAAQRPVAVMLNNLEKALPQKGNGQADIIYEALAEGGITRMLGVFQSVEGVGDIGSIRSSRPYYLDLALGLDAIYVHAGGSDEAYADIKSWGVTSVDYVRTSAYAAVFWRDEARRKSAGQEHSVFTSGERIMKAFPNYSFRKDHKDGYSLPYTFAEDGTPAGGEPASVVRVPFSNYKTGVFTYDAETGKYLVEEYGKPYRDGNTGEQVAVTNVLTIKTSCKAIDSEGRMKIDLAGSSGKGWFACGGKMVPITWAKKDRGSPITYALADGTPLTLGQGSSYVNIIPLTNTVTAQ